MSMLFVTEMYFSYLHDDFITIEFIHFNVNCFYTFSKVFLSYLSVLKNLVCYMYFAATLFIYRIQAAHELSPENYA